ncbi:hypothetical protein OG2516_14588, partial [Oceanicola granulosus HTCC2516]
MAVPATAGTGFCGWTAIMARTMALFQAEMLSVRDRPGSPQSASGSGVPGAG